ncbi:23184_t:CDS:2, partial [Gigaspora margarita]
KEISMDEEWDIIQSSIIKTAQTFLPMKKKLAEMLKTKDTGKTDILQLLRKHIRKLDKNHKQAIDTKDLARTYKGGKKPLCSENSNATCRISKKRDKNKIEIEHWNRDNNKKNFIQEGPKLKRCQGCNDEQKEQSRGCLFQRNFKSNKKAIDKKLIEKSNEKGERELLVLIKLFNFKPSINEVTTEQIKKEPAVSYLVIELLEERMLKECIKGKEVINELLTITRKL